MHPARLFHQDDPAILAALVARRGFALLVGVADGRPLVAQAPVLLEVRRLRFHLSRGNALSAGLQAPYARALAVVAQHALGCSHRADRSHRRLERERPGLQLGPMSTAASTGRS